MTVYYYLTDGSYSDFANYTFYLPMSQSSITGYFLLYICLASLCSFSFPWSLYFITLRLLSTSQLFYRMSFNLGFSDVLSQWDSGYEFLARMSQKWCCVHFSVLYHESGCCPVVPLFIHVVMGWIVSPKIHMWHSNSKYFKMWLYLETRSLQG